MLEAGLRRESGRLFGSPKDSDQPSHLGQSLAARLFDDLERLALALLLRLEQPADARRLDGHHAHAVAHDIVELAGDPRTLLGNCGLGLLAPLALESRSPLLRLLGLPELVAEAEADRPRDAEDDRAPDHVAPAPSRLVANDDRVHPDEDREAGDRLPGFRQATEEEGEGHPQQEHHRVVGDALPVQERARRDRYSRHYRRQEREAAPEQQRQEVCE